MSDEQIVFIERLAWRLLNNAVTFKKEPISYAPIRLLDGVIGLFEILLEENEKYVSFLDRVIEAKQFAVDDIDKMVNMLNQLILDSFNPNAENEVYQRHE